MYFEDKEQWYVESVLKSLEYVEWDRYVKHGLGIMCYGWIDREDEYMDFVVVDIDYMNEKIRGYVTSSKRFDEQIRNDLQYDGDMGDCIRIEDSFDLENMIELD